MATSGRNVPNRRTPVSRPSQPRRQYDTRARSYYGERTGMNRTSGGRKPMSRSMWIKEQKRKRRERERRARQRRNLFLAVILIAAAAAAVIVMRGCSGSGDPQSGSTAPSAVSVTQAPMQIQPEQLNAAYYGNAGETVFVGNALAEGLSNYCILPGADFCTSTGATVENTETVAANNDSAAILDKLKAPYTKVFLCFGENELAWNDAERFSDSYGKLVDKVRELKRTSSIYLVGIPPVAKNISDSGTAGMTVSNISAYNEAIRSLAAEKDVIYADCTNALSDGSGYLPDGISADGISLNRSCYIKLLNYIAQNAEIPSEDDTSTEKPESGSTEKPSVSSTSAPTPAPTVNVLKDTDTSKKTGGDND